MVGPSSEIPPGFPCPFVDAPAPSLATATFSTATAPELLQHDTALLSRGDASFGTRCGDEHTDTTVSKSGPHVPTNPIPTPPPAHSHAACDAAPRQRTVPVPSYHSSFTASPLGYQGLPQSKEDATTSPPQRPNEVSSRLMSSRTQPQPQPHRNPAPLSHSAFEGRRDSAPTLSPSAFSSGVGGGGAPGAGAGGEQQHSPGLLQLLTCSPSGFDRRHVPPPAPGASASVPAYVGAPLSQGPASRSLTHMLHDDMMASSTGTPDFRSGLAQFHYDTSRSVTPQLPPPEMGFAAHGTPTRGFARAGASMHSIHSANNSVSDRFQMADRFGASTFESSQHVGAVGRATGTTSAQATPARGVASPDGCQSSASFTNSGLSATAPVARDSDASSSPVKRGYTKLYVGQLPPGDEASLLKFLNAVFEPYGVQEIKLWRHKQRLAAFVWCGSKQKAETAVATLHGTEYAGPRGGPPTALCVEPAHSSYNS